MTGSKKAPNIALRRIREMERQESRAEFANALASLARKMGEPVSPSERYIARLEDGDVRFPSAPYRRVLTALCSRPISELGFTLRHPVQVPSPATAGAAPQSTGLADGVAAFVGESGALAAAFPPASSESALEPDWPVWFGTRLVRLIALADGWHNDADQLRGLQALFDQEVLMSDAIAPAAPSGAAAAFALSRRQALAALAALPLAAGMSQGPAPTSAAADAFLPRCAASLVACWHLLRGADLDTVSQAVSAYIVELGGIARQSSRYRATAARLASQAHRIAGIVALHRGQLASRQAHYGQALFYADIADDAASRAAALISLANNCCFYYRDPVRAAGLCERALSLESEISPLQRSRTHAELAVVYGQLGREREAVGSVDRAQDLYPDGPEQDPSFLFAEFTPASLSLNQGLAYLALAEKAPGGSYAAKAAHAFGDLDKGSRAAPERIRIEIANHHAVTAVHLNDLDAFVLHMTDALEGAAALRSAQRKREAVGAWNLAAARWPREPRVLALSDGVRAIRPDAAVRRS